MSGWAGPSDRSLNILFLTQIIPYPPDAGPKVKTWHVLRYLVRRGHCVTLASFVRPEEQAYVPIMEELCAQVYTIPIHRSRPADIYYWLRSHFTGRPFLIERDDRDAMHDLVRHILAAGKTDAIHADQLTMTQFAMRAREVQDVFGRHGRTASNHDLSLIFDAHNAVWSIIERMGQNARWYLRPVLGLEARRVKRYEGCVVRQFDHTLAVTELDRQALFAAAAASRNGASSSLPAIPVIPIAVDTGHLQPLRCQPRSTNILTLGTLHYPPNADGIRWFMQEVYPLIQEQVPEATLTVVGKNPPNDFLESAYREPQSIQVTGYVPDLTPYLEQATVMVVPVRAGGGMRVRILEAFARAMPVVTTTIGLEGIDAQPGEDVLVADTPFDFAAAVVRLLKDEHLRSRLATNARALAETRYEWKVVLRGMDSVYNQIKK
ncbi:MAG TPA: glycosyltransferase [Anaerolineales bacterium]|nr:glycosyltransferase [Anaerolineales bacterium]